ncbi:hypothetical protein PVAP13_5KG678600 [Panicum virgatum]|uniref:DUF4283 domain-containing protein n=1 Tax=Panicum virgatum TaxID=38727 RepID=A0A8T0SWC5_PANVG|nr:hypothetical protein PVAP13_5KG678600 [Panicum virgatum]
MKQRQFPGGSDESKTAQGKHQSDINQGKQQNPGRLACTICGLKNHSTGECRRNMFYELCGFANHTILDCKREPFWNVGPELCAAQVMNQSFFYIDENIDPKVVREKASTAIITVRKGELSAKQIENEFKTVVSSEHWKWIARKIADNKFAMRFPSAKMVLEYSKFDLGVKGLDVQFSVEPWTSAVSAKGQLQQAWFKVGGIPVDQRGLRTIAKIGGLVGKTMQIDESTRFNRDFVRIKIACRNVELVPPSAECNMGMYIYDFLFEREVSQDDDMLNHEVANAVENPEVQASPKRPRTETIF